VLVAAFFGMMFGAVVFSYHFVSGAIDDLSRMPASGDAVLGAILVGPVAVVASVGKGVVMGGGTGLAVGIPVGMAVGHAYGGRRPAEGSGRDTWRRAYVAGALVLVASVLGLLQVVPAWFG
jgi:hypothetical protein